MYPTAHWTILSCV